MVSAVKLPVCGFDSVAAEYLELTRLGLRILLFDADNVAIGSGEVVSWTFVSGIMVGIKVMVMVWSFYNDIVLR